MDQPSPASETADLRAAIILSEVQTRLENTLLKATHLIADIEHQAQTIHNRLTRIERCQTRLEVLLESLRETMQAASLTR